MNAEQFNAVLNEQLETIKGILQSKAKEYATDDRLHNFKVAAEIQNCTPEQALAGMMAKHTISVYDMINSGEDYSVEQWSEKITDHINYLILLKALVKEEQEKKVSASCDF